jgi:DNA polymerase elongation subunit (family B)
MQKDILKSVLLGNEKNGIVQFLQEQKQMILDGEYRPEEIAIPKGMSKPPHEYTASMPAHVAGAIYCNKFCGGNIGQEKVRYLYVKKQPAGLPPTHVISFVDTFPTGFEIDYERMAKLLIDDKFETIFRSLDWNIREVDIKRNTLEEWF